MPERLEMVLVEKSIGEFYRAEFRSKQRRPKDSKSVQAIHYLLLMAAEQRLIIPSVHRHVHIFQVPGDSKRGLKRKTGQSPVGFKYLTMSMDDGTAGDHTGDFQVKVDGGSGGQGNRFKGVLRGPDQFRTVAVSAKENGLRIGIEKPADILSHHVADHAGKPQFRYKGAVVGKQHRSLAAKKRKALEVIDGRMRYRCVAAVLLADDHGMVVVALDGKDPVAPQQFYTGIRRFRAGGIADIPEVNDAPAVPALQKRDGIGQAGC